MSENIIKRSGTIRSRRRPLFEMEQDQHVIKVDLTAYKKSIFSKMGFASEDRLLVVKTIRKGVGIKALNVLADNLDLTVKDISGIVDISYRTLNRRRKTGLLTSEETERVYRVASLIVRTNEVLHDHNEAMHWLKTPKKALGGEIPLNLADTEVGADEVKDLLGRIEHGVFV